LLVRVATKCSFFSALFQRQQEVAVATTRKSDGFGIRATGRRYYGTACHVTDSVNCTGNGQSDAGYLDWRSSLPSAASTLRSSATPWRASGPSRWSASWARPRRSRTPIRRWAFPLHNVIVSSYRAPFLARAAAANYSVRYNSALRRTSTRWPSGGPPTPTLWT
jgi:hypothetical protein